MPEETKKKPSIGRIVHYRSYGTPGGEFKPEPRAAVVTAVHFEKESSEVESVDLCVLNPTGMFFNQNVKYSETEEGGRWSWPPYVA